VTQNPQDAAAFAARIEDPETQRMAFAELLNLWGALDPEESGDWVRSLPKGASAQSATGAYVDAVLFWAPDRAAELAITLDAGFREEKLKQCLERWRQLDEEAANRWLEENSLSAGMKKPATANERSTLVPVLKTD
jgi:hypothetical protein